MASFVQTVCERQWHGEGRNNCSLSYFHATQLQCPKYLSSHYQADGKMQFGLINFHFLSIAGGRVSGGTTSTEKTSGEGRWAGCQRPRWVAAHQPLITPISPSISAQNLTHAHFIGGFSMRSRGLASVPMAGKLFARISRGCQPTWSLAETKQLSRAPTAIYGLKLSPRVCRVMTKDWL